MVAFCTDNNSNNKGQVPSTEKVSLGKKCQEIAKNHYLNLGYILIRENWHFKWAEIDLLFYHERKQVLKIVEVRGRTRQRYLPSKMLSWTKIKRLKNLALVVSHRYKKSTSVDLAQVIVRKEEVKINIYGLVPD